MTVGSTTRVLVIEYSQSGDVSRAAEAVAADLVAQGVEVVWERLHPSPDYPYPWRSVRTFFDMLPECVLGRTPLLRPLSERCSGRFSLVILAYQVWFLKPSLPIQALLTSQYSAVLRGTDVVTLSVSRNMWLMASESMKERLEHVGASHVGQLVATHQGPPWATFVSTVRGVLWGKRKPLWGLFPAAGIGDAELSTLREAGRLIATHVQQDRESAASDALQLPPLRVRRRYIVPELLGSYVFAGWARCMSSLGMQGGRMRRMAAAAFVPLLIVLIVVCMPVVIGLTLLLRPLLAKRLDRFVDRINALKRPQGADARGRGTQQRSGPV